MIQDHPIILFDGVCNYCNKAVNFAIRNDKKAILRFAPIQSIAGQKIKEEYNIPPNIDSMILIEKGKVYAYSQAAIRIAKHLSWPAKALYAFIVIPPFVRQFFYKWFARKRYKWFGKRETCMIPTEDVKARFLD